MRLWMLAFAAVLIAGPVLAAGGGSHSASSGGASNRYQATWTVTPAEDSESGETEIVYDSHSDESGHEDGEAADDHAAPASHAPEDASGEDPQIVEMPIVVAPIVVDGELVNYAFVTARLDVTDGHDPWAVREQTAYIRDSMLRAAHAEPLNDAGNAANINRDTANRVWTAAANRVLGEGVVGGVFVVTSDVRYPQLAGGR